jgi:hypothetical protein
VGLKTCILAFFNWFILTAEFALLIQLYLYPFDNLSHLVVFDWPVLSHASLNCELPVVCKMSLAQADGFVHPIGLFCFPIIAYAA